VTTVDLEHTSSGTAAKLRKKAARVRDLTPADADALEAAVAGNAGINFDPGHPLSVATVANGELILGTRSKRYAELMRMPYDAVAAVYLRHVNGGR
jgi:hypothetical protein